MLIELLTVTLTLSHCGRRQTNHLILTCDTAAKQRHALTDTHGLKHAVSSWLGTQPNELRDSP